MQYSSKEIGMLKSLDLVKLEAFIIKHGWARVTHKAYARFGDRVKSYVNPNAYGVNIVDKNFPDHLSRLTETIETVAEHLDVPVYELLLELQEVV